MQYPDEQGIDLSGVKAEPIRVEVETEVATYRPVYLNSAPEGTNGDWHMILAKLTEKVSKFRALDRIVLIAYGETRDEAYNRVSEAIEQYADRYELDDIEAT